MTVMSTPNRYILGSHEFIAITVLKDGEPASTGLQFAVLDRDAAAPGPDSSAWAAPSALDGEIGVWSDVAPTPGRRAVWAKVTDNPEVPITLCGYFDIVPR